jgi:hypothetical protein
MGPKMNQDDELKFSEWIEQDDNAMHMLLESLHCLQDVQGRVKMAKIP